MKDHEKTIRRESAEPSTVIWKAPSADAPGSADADGASRFSEICRTFETTFGGVMTTEFLIRTVRLYSDAFAETALNVLIERVEDPRAAIVAAHAEMGEWIFRLLDSAEEFNMGGPDAYTQALETINRGARTMDADTKQAIERIETTLGELQSAQSQHVARGDRIAAALLPIWRAAGLPDNQITALVSQFTIGGTSPTQSRVGDVVGMFQTALGGAMNAAAVTMDSLFRGARERFDVERSAENEHADTSVALLGDVKREIQEAGASLIKEVISTVSRTGQRRPPAQRGAIQTGDADRIIPGLGELGTEMDKAFGPRQ